MKKAILIEIISILFVILFVYTGVSKLLNFNLFSSQISMSPILAPVSKLIGWFIPLVELVASGLLLVPAWRLKGLYASLVLMLSFTIYIILILKFNDHLPCSCGGIIEDLSWNEHLLFNSIFILLAVLGIWLSQSHITRLRSTNSHS